MTKNSVLTMREVIMYLEKEFKRSIEWSDVMGILKMTGTENIDYQFSHRQLDLIRSLLHNWNGYTRR